MESNFTISDNAAKRLGFLLSEEPSGSRLRVSVLGGGCSGFQYLFDFDANAPKADDKLFTHDKAHIIVDETSLELLGGAMLDYVEHMGSAAFEIKNPNATSSCGCGNSFSIG